MYGRILRYFVAIVIVAIWLWWFHRDLRNLLAGPQQVDAAAVTKLAEAGDLGSIFVSLTAGKPQFVSTFAYTQGKKPYAIYAWLPVGDNRLLAILPSGQSGPRYTGFLEPPSNFETRHLLPRLEERDPGVKYLLCRLNAIRPIPPLLLWMTAGPVGVLVLLLCIRRFKSGNRR